MFVVTEADAAAIRAIFDEEGELSAAIELRRRFLGVIDNAKARACARTISGWTTTRPAQNRDDAASQPARIAGLPPDREPALAGGVPRLTRPLPSGSPNQKHQ